MAEKHDSIHSASTAGKSSPALHALAPQPTNAGVFGITRATRVPPGTAPARAASDTPAATETTSLSPKSAGGIDRSTGSTIVGFTASSTRRASRTAAAADSCATAPCSRSVHFSSEGACGSKSATSHRCSTAFSTAPSRIAAPIFPHPMIASSRMPIDTGQRRRMQFPMLRTQRGRWTFWPPCQAPAFCL